ncbi:PIG-L family deacetylase [Edaphobacter dinghuensis]|uniref:GlcNAc-PI de-N-acetylase n=1 Tax=Edaphobacter dinghuensis TaxID=1560005 RepID=A0A917M2S5_9BACT|nr:PIG-L family deacetylase [Edaphobacter dinghuensis]GGG73596.1 GlcNAc-PI de-N-acetylase [Edaphobacter dinghuensis]
MMIRQAFSGFGVFAAIALVLPSFSAWGQASHDPANLAGEQVKASVVVDPLAANRGTAALEQNLKKLSTRASLLMIVAHPDDEDGGMLTYESRGQGARVGMLTLTRGEGGQNAMSGDFDGALALLRTQELLAADRYMGVDQMFGTEVDFGFSKTKEESFAKWTHERVLYDAVRAVRLYRPLVVTSVFVGGVTDGHGQHQVSGEIAQEVFTAAADPKVFPEMGLEPWAPAKVYERVPFSRVTEKGMYDYATGKYAPARFYNYVTKTWSNEAPQANVEVPEGDHSDVLGMSYVQFARRGLSLQRSQMGPGGRTAPAGRFDVGYTRYGSRVGGTESEKSFFDGVDVSVVGIADLAPSEKTFLRSDLQQISKLVDEAQTGYSAAAPEKIAPLLKTGLAETRALIARVEAAKDLTARERYDVLHELCVKEVQFNDALVESLGLQVEVRVAPGSAVVPGSTVDVNVKVINGGKDAVRVVARDDRSLDGSRWTEGSSAVPGDGVLNAGATADCEFKVSEKADGNAATRPYFTQKNLEQPYYDVQAAAMRLAPLPLPAETVWITAKYEGVDIRFGQVALAATPTTAGVVSQPLTFEPGLSVSMQPSAGIIPLGEQSFPLTVHVRSAEPQGARGTLQLKMPAGWRSQPDSAKFVTQKPGEEQTVKFVVTPGTLGEKAYTLTTEAISSVTNRTYTEGYRAVGYTGLTLSNLYSPATYRTSGVDVKVAPHLKVGYLPGTGDDVQRSLENIGIHATTLTMADVAQGRLAGYDAVALGVRAYAAHPDLAAANGQLLSYAKNGGVVIVQYNTAEFDGDGPYPLSLGSAEKVINETDPVRLLMPSSPLLSWPNKITSHDFDGWVEERGHGFLESWDPHYEAPLETHDPGQDPQKGGLVYARTGKGAYIYVAYALYRQMPEGVPGAYRLFANLLSIGKKAK